MQPCQLINAYSHQIYTSGNLGKIFGVGVVTGNRFPLICTAYPIETDHYITYLHSKGSLETWLSYDKLKLSGTRKSLHPLLL